MLKYFKCLLAVLISIDKRLENLEKCMKYGEDGHSLVVNNYRNKIR